MAQPTAAQVSQYRFHREHCQIMRIPQATLEHRVLQGSLSVPSSTGNVLYAGPGPATADLVQAKTTLVWLVTEPIVHRSGGSSTEIGRQAVPMVKGQCPVIDDFQNPISISHDDLMVDAGGVKYRVQNPVLTPDNSLVSFSLIKIR